MAIFDNVVGKSTNFKGYEGNPPATEAEYNDLDCWTDASLAPTWAEVSAEMATIDVQQTRASEYPPIGDQLDQLYWDKKNGTNTWEEGIDAVKAAHPKP